MIAEALALLAPTDDFLVPSALAPMTREEAHSCLWAIRTTTANLRALVHDLYHRQGWKVLGYASFRECIAAELSDVSESQLYRQVSAGEIEQEVSPETRIGTIPEATLRPLGKVPPIARRPVYEAARQASLRDAPSAREIEEAADRILLQCGQPAEAQSLPEAVKADTRDATALAADQINQRDAARIAQRLERTLHHLTIALKGLNVCGKVLAAEHCQHAIDLAQ